MGVGLGGVSSGSRSGYPASATPPSRRAGKLTAAIASASAETTRALRSETRPDTRPASHLDFRPPSANPYAPTMAELGGGRAVRERTIAVHESRIAEAHQEIAWRQQAISALRDTGAAEIERGEEEKDAVILD